ncbi:MAG: hypothetical protein R3352_07400 [Salinisphaeraceae bacterium]|nr:hypothetical protein [Salinisphaeraceae bacterium]
MRESLTERLSRQTAEALEQRLQRWQERLNEVETQAPPRVYQMIEALREVVTEDSRKAREKVVEILTQIGTTENEFLSWLEQDFQLLEEQLFTALTKAADPTTVELEKLRAKDGQD